MIRKFVIAVVCLTLAALTACGPSHKMIAEGMNSPDVEKRREAAKVMRGAKKITKEMTPSLLMACRDPDDDVRMYAYFAIKNADPREEGVVGALMDGMRDTSVDVRRAVVSSLGEINPFPTVCFPQMVNLLVDPDDHVRRFTYSALADMEGLGIGSLMRQIDSPNADLRLEIVKVLGSIGGPAKAALPKLRAMENGDEDLRVKEAAARSIVFIENY